METITRVALVSLGDVGNQLMLNGIVGMPKGQVHLLFINTNQPSLDAFERKFKKWCPELKATFMAIGKKAVPKQNGTGKNPELGEKAAKEAVEEGTDESGNPSQIRTWFNQHPSEAVVFTAGLGDGGTGRGGANVLIDYFMNVLKLMTFSNFGVASSLSREVNYTQSQDIEGRLDKLDKNKVAYVHGHTSKLRDIEGMTKSRALHLLGRAVSGPIRGFTRMLNEPFAYDRSNILRLYVNPLAERRPWLMTTTTVPKAFSQKEAERAAKELMNDTCAQFELGRIGKALFIMEGELELAMESAVFEQIYRRVNEAYREIIEKDAEKKENLPKASQSFAPQYASYSSTDPVNVRITMWALENQVEPTDVQLETVEIKWLDIDYDSMDDELPSYFVDELPLPAGSQPQTFKNAAPVTDAGTEPGAQHEVAIALTSDTPLVQDKPAASQGTPQQASPAPVPPPLVFPNLGALLESAKHGTTLAKAILAGFPDSLPEEQIAAVPFLKRLRGADIRSHLSQLADLSQELSDGWKVRFMEILEVDNITFQNTALVHVTGGKTGLKKPTNYTIQADDTVARLLALEWFVDASESARQTLLQACQAQIVFGSRIFTPSHRMAGTATKQ